MIVEGEVMQKPHGAGMGSYRPTVRSRNGLVCSGHPLASQAGIAALQAGGNAVDAAVACAATLGVVEPHMSGLGGDGFILVYWREHERLYVINATGAAPKAATLAAFGDGIPLKGARSVSVPGLVAGWFAALERFARLSPKRLFAAAIDLAGNGFPVSGKLAAYAAAEPALCCHAGTAAIFAPQGAALREGQLLVQADLARTMVKLAANGPAELYQGDTGRRLVDFVGAQGGLLSLEDMECHRTTWHEPISTEYRGYTVFNAPPNSSGVTLLQMLNLAREKDTASLPWGPAEQIHCMVEAKRLSFADRERYVMDPEWGDIPVEGLLSAGYAAERAGLIGYRALDRVEAGDPWRYQDGEDSGAAGLAGGLEREDTTCFAVIDAAGNAVCQLQSIQSPFGAALVADGTGILLNNRMTYWNLEDGHVNQLAPGKRVRHTMNPCMAFQDGQLRFVFGTPGADTQVQTNLQTFTAMVDHGAQPQEAVEAPRWRHAQQGMESTVPHGLEEVLELESRFPADVQEELASRGHKVRVVEGWAAAGSEVVIEVDATTGAYAGGADPRRDGYVAAY